MPRRARLSLPGVSLSFLPTETLVCPYTSSPGTSSNAEITDLPVFIPKKTIVDISTP